MRILVDGSDWLVDFKGGQRAARYKKRKWEYWVGDAGEDFAVLTEGYFHCLFGELVVRADHPNKSVVDHCNFRKKVNVLQGLPKDRCIDECTNR